LLNYCRKRFLNRVSPDAGEEYRAPEYGGYEEFRTSHPGAGFQDYLEYKNALSQVSRFDCALPFFDCNLNGFLVIDAGSSGSCIRLWAFDDVDLSSLHIQEWIGRASELQNVRMHSSRCDDSNIIHHYIIQALSGFLPFSFSISQIGIESNMLLLQHVPTPH
jgi:hypothetical protein